MQDIAILTGGEFLAEELGREAREPGHRRPRARRSASSSTRTTRRSSAAAGTRRTSTGAATRSASKSRRRRRTTIEKSCKSDWPSWPAAWPSSVWALHREAEMKSRKEALEDAISATKAAMAEGIVPGGGLTLLRAIDAVEQRGGSLRRRRTHRPANPQAGPRSADAADRRKLGDGRRRGRRSDAGRHRQLRLRCGPLPIRRPGRGGHHRSRPRSFGWPWKTPSRSPASCS